MKRMISRPAGLCVALICHLHILLILVSLLTGYQAVQAQYVNIPLTGFNGDVVANSVGATNTATTGSMPGVSFPAIGIDGNSPAWSLVDNNYKWYSAGTQATCGLPATNQVTSALTPGMVYTLQNYTGNNAMTVNSGTYAGDPYGTTGTVTLVTPASYGKLVFLYESVNNTPSGGTSVVNGTITFTDNSTQAFSFTTVNWFTTTGGNIAYTSNLQRAANSAPGTPSTCQTTGPCLFEVSAPILASNWSKQVASVSFTYATSAGTTASTVNYLHILAAGGIAPCVLPTFQPTGLNLSSPTGTSISGTFTAASGSPTGYLAVAYPAGSTATAPSSGTDYTIGTAIGSFGKVVGVGAATNFVATGLLPGQGYDIYVYSYNGGTCATAYNTTSPLFGNITTSNIGATLLINPFGDGGFETGTTLATNNWTVVNSATNQWVVGSVPTGFSNRSAYISNNGGAAWSYTNSSVTASSIYKDITFPAGQTEITISFDWKANGETSAFDAIILYTCATTITPNTSSPTSTSNAATWTGGSPTPIGAQLFNAFGSTQKFTACLPASFAGTTQRIVFTWKNDGSLGTDPPGAIDNIALVSNTPTPPAGQATAPVFAGASTSSITGSFAAAAPAAPGYLIVRYFNGAAPTAPSTGTTYTAGQTLGSGGNTGTIVYSGAYSSPQTFGGLTANTAYDFYIYTYNSSTCAGTVYNTVSPTFATATTNACGGLSGGTYSVGPTGTYATLTAALTAIGAGVTGPVILELQPTYVSTSETFPITFPYNPCIGAANSVTIRPNSAAPVLTIAPAAGNATATIDFNGAQYITIDGRPGGVGTSKNLVIANSLTTAVSTIRFINEASNNNLMFCDIQGSSTTSANPTTSGVVFIGSTTGLNGNDNNTISSCDIHSVGANLPAIGIGASNTTTAGSAANNDNNTITGCNIYDIFSAGSATTHIKIDAGNNGFVITNNRMYQTATRTITGAVTYRFIWLNPNSSAANVTYASGHVVTGNTFGGASSSFTGTLTLTSTTTANFQGMDISIGNGTGTVVNNNTLGNISFTSTNASTTGVGIFTGFSVNYGNVSQMSGNTIGSAAAPITISSTATATTGVMTSGLRLGGGILAPTLNGNFIGSITCTNPTVTVAPSVVGILVNAATMTPTLSNNNIGPLTVGTSATTATGAALVNGIQINNTVGTTAITGNTIHDLTNFAQSSNTGTSASILGILFNGTVVAAPVSISGNTIFNLNNAAVTTTLSFAPYVQGIYLNGGTSTVFTVNGNLVHSLATPGWNPSSGTATGLPFTVGINAVSASSYLLSNNMIRLGIDGSGAATTQPSSIRGIYRQATTGSYTIHHNSVYIGGANSTTSNAALQTAAYFRQPSSTTVEDLRNNIFVNVRTNASANSTSRNYAVYIGSNTTPPTVSSNLYQASGGTGNLFAFNGTADVQGYSSSSPWVAGDNNSFQNDPQFVNATGNTASVDLHINAAVGTAVEGTGTASTVTSDFDGQLRSGLTPVDIGADAGNFTTLPACAPPNAPSTLVLTPISNSQINGTFTAASPAPNAYLVVRYNASPAPTITAPVNGTNYLPGNTLGSGTVVAVTTTPSFSSTGLLGDFGYTYYVYAVNNNCLGTVTYNTASPIFGSANTLPCSGLSGIVPVGGANTPPTSFSNLTNAMAFINANGLTSSTILELQSTYPGAAETFPITIGTFPCSSPSKTLTIRPAAGVNGKVITSAAVATFDFSNASNVTIDGRPGGVGSSISVTPSGSMNSTNLNIVNTSTTGVAVRLDNQSSNNMIQYADLQGASTTSAALPGAIGGVVYIGNVTGTNGNDNNTIDHCNIHSTSAAAWPTMCVYSFGPAGSTAITANFNDNNNITNNNIYDYFSLTQNSAGVEAERGTNGWTISGNSFFQTGSTLRNPTTASQIHRAIYIAPSNGATVLGNGFNITGNFIGGSAPLCSGSPTTMAPTVAFSVRWMDINVAGGSATNIKSNTIQNISLTETGTADLMDAIWLAQNGSVNIGGPLASDGNTIGSASTTGNILLNNNNNGVTANHMIIAASSVGAAAQVLIQNNIVGGITLNGSGSSFSGIFCNGSPTITIDRNLVGSTLVANSIQQASAASTNAQFVRGINIPSSGATLSITNNTIANISNAGTNTTGGTNGTNANNNHVSGIYVISTSTTAPVITGNIIFNLSTASPAVGGGTAASLVGIAAYNTTATAPLLVSGNTIHSLTSSAASGAVQVAGILFTGPSQNNIISKNFIHSLDVSSANTTLSFRGIELLGGTSTVVNNMIRLGIKPNGSPLTAPITLYGIVKSTATNINFYHNTVYIGGTGVGSTANNTFAFNRFTSGSTDDVRNNIFINNRSNATTGGKHYQVSLSANTTITLNNNIYNGLGTGAVFGFNGTVDLATYAPGWAAGDVSSFTDDPFLVNPTGTSSTINLHIQPSVPTRVEQFGDGSVGISDDFDGDDRSLNTPTDIGADAGNYTALFFCGGAPILATASLTNNALICGSGSRTIILSGVSAVPGLSYQWKESTTGLAGTFQKIIINGTGPTYTTPVLTQTMFYLCEVTCDVSQITTPSTIVSVVINPVPTWTVTPPNGTNVCDNALVDLTANVSNTSGNTYNWNGHPNPIPSGGTGGNPGSFTAIAVYTTANNLQTVSSRPVGTVNTTLGSNIAVTSWTYTLTVTSSAGCASSDSIRYNVIPATIPQTLTFAQSPSPSCSAGTPVTLTVNNTGSIGAGSWIYNWYDQAGTTLLQTATNNAASNSYSPPTPVVNGNYVYTATVSNSLCPSSYAKTSPAFFVGYTSSKVITPANCGNNGTVTVYPTGQNNFTTWYSNNFNTGLLGGGQDASFGNTTFSSGDCRLTTNTGSINGAFIVKNPLGINTNNLQVDFKLTSAPRTLGFSFYGADGMAWSYGPDVTQGQVTISSVGMNAENGSGSGIRLAFDGAANTGTNQNGVYLMYNCLLPDQGPETPGVIAFKKGSYWQGLVNAPMSITITEDGLITVTLNNAILFDHIQLPAAYLAANKSTWTHGFTARTGGAFQVHAIDDLSIRYNSYQYSSNSTTGLNGTWQASNVLTGLAPGTYNIWVRNPSDTTCAANTGSAVIPFAPSPTVANTVTVSGSNPILCQGSTIALTTDVYVPGAIFLWESAPSASGPWTPAAGNNTTRIYNSAGLLADTWFRCTYTCPAGSPVTASPILVDVNVGSIASVNGPYFLNCPGKPITLTATPNPFTTLVWYAGASGGSPIGTGNTYVATPDALPATYYVEPTTTLFSNHFFHGGQTVGLNANSFGSLAGITSACVRFTTTGSVIIDSITIVPVGTTTGVVTIALQNAQSSVNLQTFNYTVTASQLNSYVVVPVNFTIVGAGNYQLTTSSSAGVTCNYWPVTYTGPYATAAYMTMGGGILTVTGSSTTPTGASATNIYGTIFDFNISTACASGVGTRVPVVITTNPAAVVNVTPNSATACQGAIKALTASSTSSYSSFTWAPVSNLFSDPAGTIPYSGSNASTVYSRSFATGPVTYTVTGTGGPDGCSNNNSAALTITPAPAVNISTTGASLCPGSSATLSASSSNSGYSYSWTPGGSTNNSISVTPSVHTNYTVNAVDNTNGVNAGCVTSQVQGVGIKKLSVVAMADPVSICSGDNSSLSATALTTAQYILNSSTPAVVPIPGGGVVTLNNTVGLASGNYNDGYWNVNLPFNFSFFGDLFNNVYINTNGFITFGSGTVANSAGIIPNASAPNNAVYFAAKDWTMAASGTIKYFTVGAAPNRRFVINYSGIPAVSGTGTLNGQIILSEAFGQIDLVLTGTDASSVKTLGIENGDGTFAYAPALRNGVSWTVSSAESWQFVPLSGSITYAWTPAANLNDPTSPTPVASSIFTTTTFTVAATDALSGCSNSAQQTVTTGATLSAIPEVSDTAICVGQSATLSVNPTGGCSPYTYTWDDGFNIISTSNFANVAPTTTTDYNLTVVDNVSNVYVYTVTIHVNPVPNVTVTNGLICGSGTATLTASGASTYTWTPATSLNTTTGPVVVSSTGATRIYTVTGSTPAGCSSSAISTVNVSSAITVTATAMPTNINTGHNAQLSAAVPAPGLFELVPLTGMTYAPLTGAGITTINTAGQLLSTMGTANSDDGGVVVTLPFQFPYLGNNFTQMTMCTNGWVGAGNQGTIDAVNMRASNNLFTSTIPNNTIAAWMKDMGANFPTGSGSMRYGLIGTDIFAFQWDNAVGSGFSDGSTILISFQINIYGANSTNPGRIDMIYGPTSGTIATAASIGVEDATGGTGGHFLNALTNDAISTITSSAWPGNGNGYRFNATTTSNTTFNWSPATFLSNPTLPNPVAQNMTATTTYTVTATNGAGCSASAPVTVNVGVPLAVTASTSANNFCQGGSTTLSAVATGGGLPYSSFAWSDGTNSAGTGATVTVTPSAGTTTYTVTVTDADNFTATSTVVVTVKPNPVLSLSKSGDICGTGSALLTASGTSASYTWNSSPSLVVNAPGNTATATPTVTTTYGVTGTLNGCTTSSTIGVSVFPAVVINAAANPSSICFNGNSQLSATPTSGLNFTWSPTTFLSASNIPNPQAASVTSTTTYTVTATNPTSGCTGSAQVTLTAGAPVNVVASASSSAICLGDSVTLSSAVTGGGTPYIYAWKAGAATVGTSATIKVAPSTATSYTLQVTDACSSLTSSNVVTVAVNTPPVVTAGPASSFLCSGVATSATLTASGADTYTWSPAAGLSATTGSPVIASPTLSTVYTLTGTITATGCKATATATVNVSALSATSSAYPYNVCSGSSGQVVAYAGNSASNFTLSSIPYALIPVSNATSITAWSNSDIDDGSSGPIAMPFVFNFYGTNYNQLYVGTNGYISFSDLSTITGLNSRKAANITTSTAANNIVAICYSDLHAGNGGGSVKYFTAGSAPNRVFVINFDEVFLTNTGRVQGQIQLYENTNVIEVHVTQINHGTSTSPNALGVENANGTLRQIPASRLPGVWNVPSGLPEAWRFSPNAGYSFSWSPSTFLSNTSIPNPAVNNITATTIYTVVTTETASGCQAQDTVKVTAIPLPTATISGDAEICVSSSTTLNFAFTGVAPFTYSYTDGTNTFGPFTSSSSSATKTVSPSVAKTYTVVSVSDANCTGTTAGSAIVTIDTHAPVITCPPAVTVLADLGHSYASGVALGTPVVTDNCTFTVSNNAPSTFPVGTTTVTWTATDSHGNTSACTQSVTVGDNQPPVISCPAAVTIAADLNQCSASNVIIGTATATDNNAIAGIVNSGLAVYPLGTTTVIWTATDMSGNTSTCSQSVTVTDNQAPSLTCPANIVLPNTTGQCGRNVSFAATAADNCGSVTLGYSPASGSFFPVGTTTVTTTATDAAGNTSTCTFSVTINDTENPVFQVCPSSVTAYSDPGHSYATGVALGSPVVTDNCGSVSTVNNGLFAFPLGNTTVTWTATDSHGNTSTCSQVVTVIDNQPPVITCPAPVHVSTDAGACSATQVNLGILTATDNDGVANITNNALSQYPVGNSVVTWVATDLSGNTSTCTQVVTVTDDEAPHITCPGAVTANTNSGVCYATGVVLGTPVTSDNCNVQSVSNNAPAQFPSGITTVTWTVTDVHGNTAACTQTVTVSDHQAPTLSGCPSNFSSCNPVSWTPPTALDNCTSQGVITITSNYAPGATFPAGTTTVIYTATDGAGNSSTCSFNVTRLEPSSIAGITLTSNKPFDNICLGDNITISMNGIVASSLGAGAQWKWYSGTCGGTPVPGSTNQTSITVSPSASTTYYVRAEGTCNTTACLSLPVTVTIVPPSGTTTIVYSPTFAYAGASDSIVLSPVAGATFYHWTTNGNSNILFDGHTAPYESSSPKVMLTFVSPSTQGNGIGNYHIQFFAGNACGVTSSNNIRVRATVSQPVLASGPLVACTGQTKQYSITALVGAKTYQWSFSSGAGTITGNGTSTVNVTFTSLPAVLCVHGVTANGTPGPDLCLNISTVTAAPGPISGNAIPCQGGTETYSIGTVAGAVSYTWNTTIPGAVLTQNGTSVSVVWPANTFAGNLCVKTNSGCGFSAPTCLAIVSGTVAPLGTITGPQAGVCNITGINYQVPSTGATTYNWIVPTGATISAGQGTNSILVDFSNSFAGGNVTLTSTNACGLANGTLAVTGRPDTATITGSVSVCAGFVESYVAMATGAQSYTWDVDPLEGNIIPTANANEIMVEWITNGGTVKVTTSNSCGSTGPISLVVGSSCRLAGDKAMSDALNAIVFPNPSRGQLTLQFNSPEETNYLLKITDMTGRMMQREDLHGLNGLNSHDIDLTHVAKGVYMLSLQNHAGDTIVIRLVID